MMVEKRKMIAVTAMAPTKAAPTTAIKPVQEKSAVLTLPPQSSMTRATPRLAPLLTPKTSGPARGLRKAVCSIRPLAASDAPQSVAVRAWDRRLQDDILPTGLRARLAQENKGDLMAGDPHGSDEEREGEEKGSEQRQD